MQRVITPLKKMGASIHGRRARNKQYPPLKIKGGELSAINYKMPIKSAQVKSCVLLAGLNAYGTTCVQEILKTRDHTERMLKLFGAKLNIRGMQISLKGQKDLVAPRSFMVPGDISSAAFFIVAACIIPGSKLTVRNVGLNPTRIALIKLLKRMGAKIKVSDKSKHMKAFEPYADLIVEYSKLKAITIKETDVAFAIDEIPILCVAATQAKGVTRIINGSELRIKETDRIHSMVTNLKKMGADIKTLGDDLIIKGPTQLHGVQVDSFGDHRTAMCMAIAGLTGEGMTYIKNTRCIDKSFPDFMKILKNITN